MDLQTRKERLGLTKNKENVPKVYGYIRVSTDKQAEHGHSLESQKSYILDYCQKNDLGTPEIYEDAGLSGKTIDGRPAFSALLKLLNTNDTLISIALDRISRNVVNFLQIVEILKERKVKIILIQNNITVNYDDKGNLNPMTSFTLNLMSSVNQLQVEQVREKTASVLASMKAAGTLKTKPRFGYYYNRDVNGKTTLEEIPEEQKVIDFIFSLIYKDSKITTAEITRIVNKKIEMGELKYKDKNNVQHSQIQRIILNNNLRETDTAKPKAREG